MSGTRVLYQDLVSDFPSIRLVAKKLSIIVNNIGDNFHLENKVCYKNRTPREKSKQFFFGDSAINDFNVKTEKSS